MDVRVARVAALCLWPGAAQKKSPAQGGGAARPDVGGERGDIRGCHSPEDVLVLPYIQGEECIHVADGECLPESTGLPAG